MVDDFMLRVDSVVGSAACLDASRCGKGSLASYSAPGCSVSRMTNGDSKKGGEVVECRICQEEGDECDLESPCACTGTLKFAHRKCVQKWCNKKGNITCEICSQAFAPDYVSPSSEIGPDITTIDIRQSWSSQFDLRESHLLAISAAEQELLNADYEDYAAASSRGIAFCHTVALILMLLLFIRQVFNAMKEVGMMQDISSICDVSLQVAGLFLPCYVIARSCYIRRRQTPLGLLMLAFMIPRLPRVTKSKVADVHYFKDAIVVGKMKCLEMLIWHFTMTDWVLIFARCRDPLLFLQFYRGLRFYDKCQFYFSHP